MTADGSSRSHDEIRAIFASVDNTGRWGEDDELGTLNYITPDKRKAAAGLVELGLTLSLAHPLWGVGDATHLERTMVYNRSLDADAPLFAGDSFSMETHQQEVTHLDSVSHIGSHEGLAYNGRPFVDVADDAGLTFGSIDAQRTGIFSRGVLLDVAAALGTAWLDPGREISPQDLERAEKLAGLTVGSGDVVVVRAGVEAREASEGWSPFLAGPGPDAAVWLHEREVAVYTGDAPERISVAAALVLGRLPADEVPVGAGIATRFPLPFHQIVIPAMGLVLLDHARVEELASRCRELARFEFLFVAAPLVMPGGSGSPVNPLAIL